MYNDLHIPDSNGDLSAKECANVDETFDEDIGDFGNRRTFENDLLRFSTMDEVLQAIAEADGCHLHYHKLEEAEYNCLIQHFKEFSGGHGAMEVYYSRYNAELRRRLRDLTDQFELRNIDKEV